MRNWGRVSKPTRFTLADGRRVTQEMVHQIVMDEKNKLNGGRMAEAAEIFGRMMTSPDITEFLTLEAYDYLD